MECDMKTNLTRRRVLGGGLGLLGSGLIRATGSIAQASSLRTRRNIKSLAVNDPIIVKYREAVKMMKALDTTSPLSPLSWKYQAAIHGTLITSIPAGAPWNTCPHSNVNFWPWHRAYLYYFERIIQKLSGDPLWSLPYWDWTDDTQGKIPEVFRADTTSALYDATRNAFLNDGSGELNAANLRTNLNNAFALLDFTTADSSFEGSPHGTVHIQIGGNMRNTSTAGLDPVFYLHHANIDRLWNSYLALGGGRANLNTTTWLNANFNFATKTARRSPGGRTPYSVTNLTCATATMTRSTSN
jgi:Common central domain of tyrosinase